MTWSISNLDTVIIPIEVWEKTVTNWMTSGMMIGVAIIAGSYSPVHLLLTNKSISYGQLTRDQQIVAVTHVLEALVLSLLIVLSPTSFLVSILKSRV